MPAEVAPRVLAWGADLIEPNTVQQAAKSARLPFIAGHVALMPDAHVGRGATVGSVIPTAGAIIPAAVGVDIGCGMNAVLTNLTSESLPDDLSEYKSLIERRIPSGFGKQHAHRTDAGTRWLKSSPPPTEFSDKYTAKTLKQFGTLGSGNHFLEVCLDELDRVWIVLHSGSRGIGNQLATQHINEAKALMERMMIGLEDADLAYLPEGTPEFDAYMADLLWAQSYAAANRERMTDLALGALVHLYGGGELDRINCHHNYTEREHHHGKNVWVTRKGAIRARVGDRGVIPGSMGASTFVVSGLGNPSSYDSCSHGAGRRLSRGAAKRELTEDSLRELMNGQTWDDANAGKLVDEHPEAYKDVSAVMAAQADLVTVEHTLHSILNHKGT